MTLKDKYETDWCPQYAKQLPVPMKCKRIYTIDSDAGFNKYLSFTSIGSEGNVIANGATLYFDYNTAYSISDSSRKSLSMRLRVYATQLKTRNLTIKRRALDWR